MTFAEPLPTGLQLTYFDKGFRENPYPALARLRARAPISYNPVLKSFLFTRHDDVMRILRNRDLWSDPRKANPGTFSAEVLNFSDAGPSMLLMDDPDHRRLRGLVKRSFTPRAIEGWRPRVRGVAERLVSRIKPGEFEVMEQLADPLPTMVIAEMLGVDAGMHDQFKRWSSASAAVAFTTLKDPADEILADQAQESLDEFFRGEIERRRLQPGDDLISHLVTASREDDQLSEDEIISTCNLLLLAGNLTTTDLVGNGVKAFLDHPAEAAKLRNRPELMVNAVEELLRYDSPITNSGRIAHEDMEIGGVEIGRGETLGVSLAAANRDPSIYPDPDRFQVERKDTHHQAFGGGRHICLGAHLARMEAQEAFRALLARFPEIEFGSGGHEYAANETFRGFKEFWVKAGA
jgi:cytochrome P450